MSAGRSAAIVRRWVALYTVGLPPDVRDARRAEIEDDLWNEAHDIEADEPSGDVLDRLVFGMWADITWRLEQRHRARVRPVLRSVTMGTRVVAASSIIGGPAFVGAFVLWTDRLDLTLGLTGVAILLTVVGASALAIAIWGLVSVFNAHISRGAAVLGAIGGLGVALGAVGADAPVILLPIGSAAVALDLARHGLMGWALAVVHAAAAVLLVISLVVSWTNASGLELGLLTLLYPVTWLGIGVSVLRGQPVLDEVVSSGRPA